MRFSMAPDSGNVNRVNKYIVNPWTGPIDCCWDDCWNKAREGYAIRLHEHPPRASCTTVDQSYGLLGRHAHFNFCSAKCARYYALSMGWAAHETAARNNGLIYGMAAPGDKLGRFR